MTGGRGTTLRPARPRQGPLPLSPASSEGWQFGGACRGHLDERKCLTSVTAGGISRRNQSPSCAIDSEVRSRVAMPESLLQVGLTLGSLLLGSAITYWTTRALERAKQRRDLAV